MHRTGLNCNSESGPVAWWACVSVPAVSVQKDREAETLEAGISEAEISVAEK